MTAPYSLLILINRLAKCAAELPDGENVLKAIREQPTMSQSYSLTVQPPSAQAQRCPLPEPSVPPTSTTTTVAEAATTTTLIAPPEASQGKTRIRHEWYQTPTHVHVAVMIKKVQKENVSVEFSQRQLVVDISLPASGTTYNLDLDLFEEVLPEECNFDVCIKKK